MTAKQLNIFADQDFGEIDELRRRLRVVWGYDVQTTDPEVLRFLLSYEEEVTDDDRSLRSRSC